MASVVAEAVVVHHHCQVGVGCDRSRAIDACRQPLRICGPWFILACLPVLVWLGSCCALPLATITASASVSALVLGLGSSVDVGQRQVSLNHRVLGIFTGLAPAGSSCVLVQLATVALRTLPAHSCFGSIGTYRDGWVRFTTCEL